MFFFQIALIFLFSLSFFASFPYFMSCVVNNQHQLLSAKQNSLYFIILICETFLTPFLCLIYIFYVWNFFGIYNHKTVN